MKCNLESFTYSIYEKKGLIRGIFGEGNKIFKWNITNNTIATFVTWYYLWLKCHLQSFIYLNYEKKYLIRGNFGDGNEIFKHLQHNITSDSMKCNLRIFYLFDKWEEGSDPFNRPSWKFIYPEKATKFCKIFTSLLSYVVPVKSKVKILQNFVAFSEHEL